MARDTSVKAYNEIKRSGLLKGRELDVYEVLYHHGPMTATEVYQHLIAQGRKVTQHSITPRMKPLQRKGVIKEVGKKKCQHTGKTVYLLDVTSETPDPDVPSVRKGTTCGWTEDDAGVWQSACENSFEFNTAGPVENGFEYCPYCGRVLVLGKLGKGKDFS